MFLNIQITRITFCLSFDNLKFKPFKNNKEIYEKIAKNDYKSFQMLKYSKLSNIITINQLYYLSNDNRNYQIIIKICLLF